MCRILEPNFSKTISEFKGTGISSMNPYQNMSFYLDKDFVYAATVTDFAETDSLIFRRNIKAPNSLGLRTQKNNEILLNKPQFVGVLHSDKVKLFYNIFFLC